MATEEAKKVPLVKVSIDEVKELAAKFAADLETARDHLASVQRQAEVLWRLLAHEWLEDESGRLRDLEYFPRLYIETGRLAQDLANDLGVETGDFPGEFGIDRIAAEARDLIDLIELASTPREEVAAA